MQHLNPHISAEIQQTLIAANLPPYQGGPGVDYSQANFAYAVNIVLLHLPRSQKPSAATRTLLVQRGSGDGQIGSWSGVSGYIDTPHDPQGVHPPHHFDPIMHTVHTELAEECGLSSTVIHAMQFYLGNRFTVQKFGGGTLHVLPVVGAHRHNDLPIITPHPVEISDYIWQRLDEVHAVTNLAANYADVSLPRSLHALGMHSAQVHAILRQQ